MKDTNVQKEWAEESAIEEIVIWFANNVDRDSELRAQLRKKLHDLFASHNNSLVALEEKAASELRDTCKFNHALPKFGCEDCTETRARNIVLIDVFGEGIRELHDSQELIKNSLKN